MRPRSLIPVLMLAAALFACTRQQTGPPKTILMDPGGELFSMAEKLFQAKSYAPALKRYNEFLERFPDRPLAPAALMKIGMIHAALKDYALARAVFQRVVSQYPGTSFAEDAGFELLASYYAEGRYKEVAEQASSLLKNDISDGYRLRIRVLTGDALTMAGMPAEAFRIYSESLQATQGSVKDQIIIKLKAVLEQLSSVEIESLLEDFKDNASPAGHLMYQLGINLNKDERYDAATKTLSTFIERFPLHESVYRAKRILNEINEKLMLRQKIIGCLLPLSGRFKTFGNRVLKGIEVALTRFSSRSGAPAIKLVIKDTGSDPGSAALAVKELLDENVAAIIGPVITADFAAIEAQDRGIPIITLSQKDKITEIGDYVFRNFITPKMQVEAIVSYAANVIGIKRFAILYPDEKYGATFMNLFWDELLAQGGKVVGVEKYNPAHTDFADPIKKLVGLYYEPPEDLRETRIGHGDEESESHGISEKDIEDFEKPEDPIKIKSNPDEKPKSIVDFEAIFIPDAPEKAGLIIPQLAYYDVKDVFLLGTNLWHSDRLIRMARQYVQRALIADGFFSHSTDNQVVDFVKEFRNAFREEPGFMEAIGYDTATILFEMLNRPDIRLRSDLRDHLLNLRDFKGITGITSFDDTGEARKKLYLLKIKGDNFREVK